MGEEKKGIVGKLLGKLDKKLEEKSREKPCCCSLEDKKDCCE